VNKKERKFNLVVVLLRIQNLGCRRDQWPAVSGECKKKGQIVCLALYFCNCMRRTQLTIYMYMAASENEQARAGRILGVIIIIVYVNVSVYTGVIVKRKSPSM
jgi:heme/copper-type cytochrome/quinol oxidase subunit 4